MPGNKLQIVFRATNAQPDCQSTSIAMADIRCIDAALQLQESAAKSGKIGNVRKAWFVCLRGLDAPIIFFGISCAVLQKRRYALRETIADRIDEMSINVADAKAISCVGAGQVKDRLLIAGHTLISGIRPSASAIRRRV